MHLYMLYSDMSKCFHFYTDAGLYCKNCCYWSRERQNGLYLLCSPSLTFCNLINYYKWRLPYSIVAVTMPSLDSHMKNVLYEICQLGVSDINSFLLIHIFTKVICPCLNRVKEALKLTLNSSFTTTAIHPSVRLLVCHCVEM